MEGEEVLRTEEEKIAGGPVKFLFARPFLYISIFCSVVMLTIILCLAVYYLIAGLLAGEWKFGFFAFAFVPMLLPPWIPYIALLTLIFGAIAEYFEKSNTELLKRAGICLGLTFLSVVLTGTFLVVAAPFLTYRIVKDSSGIKNNFRWVVAAGIAGGIIYIFIRPFLNIRV